MTESNTAESRPGASESRPGAAQSRPGAAEPGPGAAESRFGAPEQSPGFLLWRVTLSWQRQMRAALAPHDLTHVQFVLLASLWWLQEHGAGPPTQAQLAEQAGTDLMMTSQVIRKLESRGLVARHRDPADSRAWRLALAPDGRAALGGALADVEAADQAYFAALGGDGDAFRRGLAALSAARP